MKFLVLEEIDEFPFEPGEVFEPNLCHVFEWVVDLEKPDIRHINPLENERVQLVEVETDRVMGVRTLRLDDLFKCLNKYIGVGEYEIILSRFYEGEGWEILVRSPKFPLRVIDDFPLDYKEGMFDNVGYGYYKNLERFTDFLKECKLNSSVNK